MQRFSRLGAERRPEDLFLVQFVLGELRHDQAAPHDQDPVRQAEDLLDLGRDEEDAHPTRRQRDDQLVEGALGADVDAASRFVEQQHPRRFEEPLREEDLLLIAAREPADDRGHLRRLDGQPLQQAPDRDALLAGVDDAAGVADGRQVGQRHVVPDRQPHMEPLVLPALGQHRDPARDTVTRRADVDWGPVQLDRAAVETIGAENRPRDF